MNYNRIINYNNTRRREITFDGVIRKAQVQTWCCANMQNYLHKESCVCSPICLKDINYTVGNGIKDTV